MDFNETVSALVGLVDRAVTVQVLGRDGCPIAYFSGTLHDADIDLVNYAGEVLFFRLGPHEDDLGFFLSEAHFESAVWSMVERSRC